jgi:uncharacterized protein (TIGR03083 family)
MTLRGDIERERAAVRETLRALGPDAPSGCGEWTTGDLAVHLALGDLGGGTAVLGARTLVAWGMRIDRLSRFNTSALRAAKARRDFDSVLDRLARPTPGVQTRGPVGRVTLMELWAHHEDLLGAHPALGPCPSGIDLAPVLRVLLAYQRSPLRSLDVGVVVDGVPHRSGSVRVEGGIADVCRWLAGRADASGLTSDVAAASLRLHL